MSKQPLQPWFLTNLYMALHVEDPSFFPTIKNTIIDQINSHPNHTYIVYINFNWNIDFIGRQNDQQTMPLQTENHQQRAYTYNLNLTYNPTTTSFLRHGGHNYSQSSLIGGFFIKTSTTTTTPQLQPQI